MSSPVVIPAGPTSRRRSNNRCASSTCSSRRSSERRPRGEVGVLP
jgi:hypothetical protein